MNPSRAYARTQNETASKERLMVLLFEAALKHIRAGATALEAGQRAQGVDSILKASDIVVELSATLDPSRSPELGQTLKDLYVFVTQRLLKAATTASATPAREAERVFAPIADGFAVAVSSLATQAAR
ncbi:MAG: flagellar export chaperone FliS [Myxococcaceae bacterium]|nr:flagellar export chaperone FliS [Myxococcaceae bacterium]